MFYEEEYYYEPTQADEIFIEANKKLIEALKESVKHHVEKVTKENNRLKEDNEILRKKVRGIKSKERELEKERQEMKRSLLGELMRDRQMIFYTANYHYYHGEKCNKCDENRNINFISPLGKEMKEICDCYINKKVYTAKEYICYEMRKNKNDSSLIMWFKTYSDDKDGYTSGHVVKDKDIYNGQKYSDLDCYNAVFKTKEECEGYCEYLNNKED